LNLANKITLTRVILIPAFLVVFLATPFHEIINAWLALVIFVAAAISDAVDGYVARKYKLVTNFGKLIDPLADKLLVCSALIAYTAIGWLPAWAVIILISREFYMSGLRQLALEKQLVMAASNWGKLKTTAQLTLIIYMLVPFPLDILIFDVVIFILLILTIVLSLWSAIDYTAKNISIFKDEAR